VEGILAVSDITAGHVQDDQAVLPSATMRTSVESLLDRYFALLDGEEPKNLYKMILAEMEIPLLKKVLAYTKGNQCKAAIYMGISRGTLRKKIAQYHID
jgi:Fis family transcriptional regulator